MKQEQATAEIMYLFRYHYKHEWAPGHIFDGKSRVWIQAFNKLVKDGYITRKKVGMAHKYKWAGVWPEHY